VYGLGTVATACSLRSLGYLESDKSEGPADAQPEAQTYAQPDAQADAGAQPAYVQTCAAVSPGCFAACSGVATATCTFTQGNVLAVFLKWFSTDPLREIRAPCVTGGFTLLHNPTPDIGGPQAAALAYGTVTSSGSCAVTASASGPMELLLVIDELTNVNSVSPLDGNQSALASTGYTGTGIALDSGTLTTTRAGDYIFVAVSDDGYHATYDAGNGFILRSWALTPTPTTVATESQVQAAAGDVAGIFFSNKTGYFQIGAMAFQAR
jgi:hypothetical protein